MYSKLSKSSVESPLYSEMQSAGAGSAVFCTDEILARHEPLHYAWIKWATPQLKQRAALTRMK
jgi:hypothetical protein